MDAALSLDLSSAPSPENYMVLARKYRPKTLSQVIGQDFLVETLKRGIEGGRLGHAFILTGIRGTGKTTTARLIARSLNCERGPTAEPCGTCSSCVTLEEDRSLDVIEIDAASRTSVDDVREIIEASHYKAASSRYKIYIIDEVHMLSKSAFNALLKTLEEPPAHVKFIFATTEIHKVPATILSRCVRFDLKRIDVPVLQAYFKQICAYENVTFEEDAIALIVRTAEGSARDGLSLLDQAMTYGDGHLTTANIRKMLGAADQGVLLELFHKLMEGKCAEALEDARAFYREGVDPFRLLEDLLDLTHHIQCLKINPDLIENGIFPLVHQQKTKEFAGQLSIPTLTRMWQVLVKGLDELKKVPVPQRALEVLIIRLTHLAPVPSLEDLLESNGSKKKLLSPPNAPVEPVSPIAISEEFGHPNAQDNRQLDGPKSPLIQKIMEAFPGTTVLRSEDK